MKLANVCTKHRGRWKESTFLSGRFFFRTKVSSSGIAADGSDILADNDMYRNEALEAPSRPLALILLKFHEPAAVVPTYSEQL